MGDTDKGRVVGWWTGTFLVLVGLIGLGVWVWAEPGYSLIEFGTFYVLVWTLAAVLRYVEVTRQQLSTQRRELKATEDQWRRAGLPCVVIDWEQTSSGCPYVAHNIGPGMAVNSIYVEDLDAATLQDLSLGALAPGESVEVPDRLWNTLAAEAASVDKKRHIVLAQPLTGEEWVASGSLLKSEERLFHTVKVMKLSPEQVKQLDKQTFSEYVHDHWPELQKEMQHMMEALGTNGNK